METIIYRLVVFILLENLSLQKAHFQQKHFHHGLGCKSRDDWNTIRTVESQVMCGKLCMETSRCQAFSHNRNNRKCLLHRYRCRQSRDHAEEDGWQYYRTIFGSSDKPRCRQDLGYNLYKRINICLKLYETIRNWTSAQKTCLKDNAHLIRLDTRAKNIFIRRWILTLPQGRELKPYIGLSDLDRDMRWEWVDGKSVAFRSWGRGEPSSDGQCACLFAHINFRWNDIKCSHKLVFICEIDIQ